MSGAVPGFRGALLNKVELGLFLSGLPLLSLETALDSESGSATTSEILEQLLPLSEWRHSPAANYKYSFLTGWP